MTRTTFAARVLQVVAEIPRGETRTYQQVAEMAGSPRAYRAVGCIMSQNLDPSVPCHRVIHADGSLGNYNRAGGTKLKERILREEGAL